MLGLLTMTGTLIRRPWTSPAILTFTFLDERAGMGMRCSDEKGMRALAGTACLGMHLVHAEHH